MPYLFRNTSYLLMGFAAVCILTARPMNVVFIAIDDLNTDLGTDTNKCRRLIWTSSKDGYRQ